MEKQSEAHRLADTPFALRDGRWNFRADDELHRLHAVNEQLLEALEATLFHVDNQGDVGVDEWIECSRKACSAIEAARQSL